MGRVDDETILALLSQLMVRTDPDQILDAALRCIARVGFSKTTFDDIAREAGCARATVYRIFPSKQQLVAALLNREGERLRTGVVDAAHAEDDLAGAVTAFITTAAHTLANHQALAFVLMHEPQVILPYLAFERESAMLRLAAGMGAPAFARFLALDDATRLAEWVARITLSYLCSPSEHVNVFEWEQVRSMVDDFVLPGFMKRVAAFEGIK
jgi:AcrR family transcriptional regulator